MWDPKANLSDFLIQVQNGSRSKRQLATSTNAFGPGTANECPVQWWFKKLCTGDESWRWGAWWPATGSWQQWTASTTDWSSSNYTRSCPKTQCQSFYSPSALKQIGKVKELDKWVPHELTENQKNCHFEVSSSLILSNNDSFLNWTVMCNIKWILYDNQQRPAQWLDWAEAPKYFPKSNLHQKGVMVTVWWSAASLTHYSFLNPSKIIISEKYAQQTDEMQWKLQHLQLALVNRLGPIL